MTLDIHTPPPQVSTLSEDIDIFDPDPAKFHLPEIAWSLSGITRYNGHTHPGISVCIHSLLCLQLLEYKLKSSGYTHEHAQKLRRTVIMHDAPEYIIGDINRPLKRAMGSFISDIEDRIYSRMAVKYDLFDPLPQVVKTVDNGALACEVAKSAPQFQQRWSGLLPYDKAGVDYLSFLLQLNRHAASMLFVQEFKKATREEPNAEV